MHADWRWICCRKFSAGTDSIKIISSFEPSNLTESKHNTIPLLCGYCKGYWTSQVHTFWRGAQWESMTDRLTLFSTRLYDFILFNSRYFMHFDDWWACLWVSKWWERSLFWWKVLQIDELLYAMFLSQTSIISIQIPW